MRSAQFILCSFLSPDSFAPIFLTLIKTLSGPRFPNLFILLLSDHLSLCVSSFKFWHPSRKQLPFHPPPSTQFTSNLIQFISESLPLLCRCQKPHSQLLGLPSNQPTTFLFLLNTWKYHHFELMPDGPVSILVNGFEALRHHLCFALPQLSFDTWNHQISHGWPARLKGIVFVKTTSMWRWKVVKILDCEPTQTKKNVSGLHENGLKRGDFFPYCLQMSWYNGIRSLCSEYHTTGARRKSKQITFKIKVIS